VFVYLTLQVHQAAGEQSQHLPIFANSLAARFKLTEPMNNVINQLGLGLKIAIKCGPAYTECLCRSFFPSAAITQCLGVKIGARIGVKPLSPIGDIPGRRVADGQARTRTAKRRGRTARTRGHDRHSGRY